jgi:hypothetical protein
VRVKPVRRALCEAEGAHLGAEVQRPLATPEGR